MVIVNDGTRAKTSYFYSDACDAPTTVSLPAPARSIEVVPESPRVWQTVAAWDTDDFLESVATTSDVRVEDNGSRPVVRWTASPNPALCDPNPAFRVGWYSADRRFRLAYRERIDFRLAAGTP